MHYGRRVGPWPLPTSVISTLPHASDPKVPPHLAKNFLAIVTFPEKNLCHSGSYLLGRDLEDRAGNTPPRQNHPNAACKEL